ncbi:MAG: dUTP diphosphatase [Pseudomonadales bacterium]|jgi:hypothetical protein|nr:dUTP diphosphatase [Pseudomonadales bacterium]
MTAPDRDRLAAMLEEMGRLQASHNAEVDPAWRTAGLAYDRAIWVECAELLDHYGWKWWKKQTPDLDQVELELVDIWHFGLSLLLRDGGTGDALVEAFASGLPGERRAPGADGERFRRCIERLAAAAVAERRFDVEAFLDCLAWLGMDAASLYASYVGKNVLNGFRQRNGYKDGSYRKVWAGREDNEHLVEIVAGLDVTADGFAGLLAEALAERYAQTA